MNSKSVNILKALIILFMSFTFFSCVSTRYITLEIPEKAKKELPENIQSFVIISRVINDDYNIIKQDSLQRIFYKEGFNYDTIINDISVVDTTLKALGELLYESGRFDVVIPEDRLQINQSPLPMSKELSWNEVNEWCDTFKTNAVLSLDYFKTRVITEYDKIVQFDQGLNDFYDFVHARMLVKYEALFRIYDPLKQRVIMRKIMQDTLVWEGTDRSTSDLFYHFTPVKKALYEAGVAIALDFSGEISPVWRTEKRSYFATGDDSLKKAALLVENNQWNEAMEIWKETVSTAKSKSLKSKAEFNLAVAYEISGDIETSIKWALQSYETMFRSITYNYLELLENRKTELQKERS